jgi:hypothetical protein
VAINNVTFVHDAAGVEAAGLPANPLGYGLMTIQSESGTRFTVAGDAQFLRTALKGNKARMADALKINPRKFYYMCEGWPSEHKEAGTTPTWAPLEKQT